MILLVTQLLIFCYLVVEGLVIIIIVVSTLALKLGQLRQGCMLGGTSTQPVKQPYGLSFLIIVIAALPTEIFAYGAELVPSTAEFPKNFPQYLLTGIATLLIDCAANAINKGKLHASAIQCAKLKISKLLSFHFMDSMTLVHTQQIGLTVQSCTFTFQLY